MTHIQEPSQTNSTDLLQSAISAATPELDPADRELVDLIHRAATSRPALLDELEGLRKRADSQRKTLANSEARIAVLQRALVIASMIGLSQ